MTNPPRPSRPSARGSSRGPVWVVDDSKLDRDRALRALAGFDVVAFDDGDVMLERLASETPAVLLLDLTLPTISGIDLCRFVRERYDEVTLPILLLSARTEISDLEEGLAAGANDYVGKPFDDVTLVGRVRTLVRVQRQAEETRERELWLHTTLSSIGEGVIATDEHGRVLFMNAVAERLTEVRSSEAAGKLLSDLCFIEAEGTERAVLHLTRDGQRIAVEHTASPIGTAPSFRGVVHVLRDARIARARADFEEKLVGIVSHDLRNPLQTILLGTAAMLADDVDDGTRSAIQRIRRSAQRATRLISDVLDFTQARLGSGIPIRARAVDLHSLAAQVSDDVMAAHPDCRVICTCTGDGLGSWDPERLSQVFANLLSNAVKHGDRDSPVTLECDGKGDSVVVAVHNHGPPIPVELMPFMFEPMKRGTDTSGNPSRSVGLGLYIVKHIVDAHGGSITVCSNGARGTTFSVGLPRAGPSTSKPDRPARTSCSQSSSGSASDPRSES